MALVCLVLVLFVVFAVGIVGVGIGEITGSCKILRSIVLISVERRGKEEKVRLIKG